MVTIRYTGDELWKRIERAVDIVKDRLNRTVQALDSADVPYAVIGGNAVQLWVAQVDESVVRNTRDVDIAINRDDLPRARKAMEAAGFVFRQEGGVTMFLDGPDVLARDAVHVIFAGEKVRKEYPEPVPSIEDAELIDNIRAVSLEALVRLKLTSYRRKDQVHLLDMLSVNLIDESWLDRLSPELSSRLQQLIDDPDG